MSEEAHCPECGEPVSATATYCMHCYADLPDSTGGDHAGSAGDGWSDQENPDPTSESVGDPSAEAGVADQSADVSETVTEAVTDAVDEESASGAADAGGGGGEPAPPPSETDDQLLDPDGIVDNTLTIIVGIGGGIFVGIAGTIILLITTNSGWAVPLGLLAWLVATAYLSRRRTVQGAIAHTLYAIAAVLLLAPFVAWSPAVELSGLGARAESFFFGLMFVAIPAAIAGGLGFVVDQFTPESSSEG